ncbi:MAG: alkaline phosphatase [Bacteroidales bacterium]
MKKLFLRLTGSLFIAGYLVIFGACASQSSDQPVAKNIIFLIGDGMGLPQMYAARTVNGGPLALEEVTHVGLHTTHSANRYITDSGAAGTALACGAKTNNGAIGVDTSLNDLVSILKYAEAQGMATGLVSSSAITHATPAAFIANEASRNDYEAIAADFLKTDIDLFIGGGLNHFTKREDGMDLTKDLMANGYTIATSVEEFLAHTSGKLAALTAPEHNPRMLDGRGDMLPAATKKAIELLSQQENGFFVMIEGSMIDWGGHANDQEYVLTETIDFNETIKVALDFAKKDGETLVVITGDHETGGMVVIKGDPVNKTVETAFTTGGHTGTLIPVYSYGPGAELFTGIFDNTDFKQKFIDALGVGEAK